MPLFTASDLTDFLQYPVQESRAAVVERVASGWLLGQVGLQSWPWLDGQPQGAETLWGLAVELGAILIENPGALRSETSASQSTTWSQRRQEIADEVKRWGRSYGLPVDEVQEISAPARPVGTFPAAPSWPSRLSAQPICSPLADWTGRQ